MKKGFTLIELLVVVLIIGILSAIALPQYTKTVEKARFAEAVMAVEGIARAQDLYKMANGNYTRDINDLDVTFGTPGVLYDGSIPAQQGKYFKFAASNSEGDQNAKALVTEQKTQNSSVGAYSLAILIDNRKACYLYSASEQEAALCREWADSVADLRP